MKWYNRPLHLPRLPLPLCLMTVIMGLLVVQPPPVKKLPVPTVHRSHTILIAPLPVPPK